MAYQNKKIYNSITKQEIRFLRTGKETNHKLLEMEAIYHPRSAEPPAHYHPHQCEDFTILSGTLFVKTDGKTRLFQQGDVFHIPAGKIHAMWNGSEHETVVNWKVQPAMSTDLLLETTFGLANDGKTNKHGVPNIFQTALMMNKFSAVFRIAKPPFAIQRIVFMLLSPFAYLLGYRSTYKKYF